MRICILSRYPPDKGGIATHTSILANGLVKRGHDVTVITYKRLDRKSKKISFYEIPVIDIVFFRGLCFFIGSLLALLRIKEKDIIHLHPIHTIGVIPPLSGTPFIVTSHGSDVLKYSTYPVIKQIFSFVTNSADKLICVSNYLARKAKKNLKVNGKKIRVIYNSVEIPTNIRKTSVSGIRKELKLSENKKIVLFVGSLTNTKNPLVLLECAKSIDVNFLFIGDGPLKNKMKGIIRKKNLNNCKLLGSKDHTTTLKYIRAADVVAIPSEFEGFGYVAAEASILGTPVVAKLVGALKEILTKESLSNNIQKKLERVLKDKRVRDNIVKNNRKISKKFSPEVMVSEVEKVYREVLNNKT